MHTNKRIIKKIVYFNTLTMKQYNANVMTNSHITQ